MNDAHEQLLARLREMIAATPTSGAVNAGGKPLQIAQFASAVESRADDGDALVAYIRGKLYAKPTLSYDALVRAGRPDLTPEALAADADAPWASEFTDEDREAAGARLGAMLETHRQQVATAEADALEYDLRIVANVSANRVAKGKPALTDEQRETMLADRLAARSA